MGGIDKEGLQSKLKLSKPWTDACLATLRCPTHGTQWSPTIGSSCPVFWSSNKQLDDCDLKLSDWKVLQIATHIIAILGFRVTALSLLVMIYFIH